MKNVGQAMLDVMTEEETHKLVEYSKLSSWCIEATDIAKAVEKRYGLYGKSGSFCSNYY